MKKGRHRRYEQARESKRAGSGIALGSPFDDTTNTAQHDEECVECGRNPHADWCMADDGDDGCGVAD